MIQNSELILNPDGSIYHLHLQPEEVPPTILFVGDPNRVSAVSRHFDTITVKKQHREFVSHIGTFKGQAVMCLSTGIGTDNIDIVLTELDALVNIDFQTRQVKAEHHPLSIFRLGTSGSIQADIDVDSFVVSKIGIGFDNLMQFYDVTPTPDELNLTDKLTDYLEAKSEDLMLIPYAFSADKQLLQFFDNESFIQGYTVTAPGFYAPQGRLLRGRATEPKLLKLLTAFKTKTARLTNIEMETAGIYGMAKLLGHRAVSISAILANRVNGNFSHQAEATIERLIEKVLQTVIS
jgi:uridine phosphorylase